jgi:ribonucleoside-diphosphate reductase alpha chain
MSKLQKLKDSKEAPEWLSEEGYITLSKGYLVEQETPKAMYRRVARSVATYAKLPEEFKHDFFIAMYDLNFLCPATPVLANSGTDRGLNISCFTIDIDDKMEDIMGRGLGELSMLTKNGGGVGISLQRLRPHGSLIKNGKNGKSEGIIPFAKVYDSAILATKQGETRRGSASINLSVEHGDFAEFIRMRRPEGDVNRQCQNLHHCVTISDEFMHKIKNGDLEARHKWTEIMKTRIETGEPYIFFEGNVERGNPDCYKDKGLNVSATNICCLTGDSLVATGQGPKPIKDLVGKNVLIFDGKEWVNCNNFEQKGVVTELYEITLKSGSVIRATGNHRWFVQENYEQIRNRSYKEKMSTELKVGDFLEFHTQESHGTEKLESAYIKGFLIGDGTQSNGLPILNVHSTKYECLDMIVSSLSETPIDQKLRSDCITECSFGKEIIQNSHNTFGKQEFKRLKGLSARKSSIIEWAREKKNGFDYTNYDKESKLLLLSGLLDSDGTYSGFIQFSSKNKSLVESVKGLVESLGFVSSMDICNETHRLSIGSYDSYNLIKQLSCKRLKTNRLPPNRKTTGFRKIISVNKINVEPTAVYCPNIPSTGKFALANGIMTGNSEILLYTDPEHSFVCCLSSLNLTNYDQWKNWKAPNTGLTLPELAVYFLNGVLDEFIDKAKYIPYLENAIRSAVKGRAIGIGVLGWHTLLQEKMIPFESFEAMKLNNEIFKTIDELSLKATKQLALERGEPEWCKGHGIYNSHRIGIAPTRSNSIISGDVSAGIEVMIANAYTDNTAKGTFIRRNKTLQKLLEKYNKNTDEIWKSISNNNGSVQNLDFLTEKEKEVFKTAYEIDQKAIIQQAAQRQKYVCQSQSLNLFFPFDVNPKYFNDIHILAWELGVKTLYYCRSTSNIKVEHKEDNCKSCEG